MIILRDYLPTLPHIPCPDSSSCSPAVVVRGFWPSFAGGIHPIPPYSVTNCRLNGIERFSVRQGRKGRSQHPKAGRPSPGPGWGPYAAGHSLPRAGLAGVYCYGGCWRGTNRDANLTCSRQGDANACVSTLPCHSKDRDLIGNPSNVQPSAVTSIVRIRSSSSEAMLCSNTGPAGFYCQLNLGRSRRGTRRADPKPSRSCAVATPSRSDAPFAHRRRHRIRSVGSL